MCQATVSNQEGPTRVSSKNVLPESQESVSSGSVPQKCQIKVCLARVSSRVPHPRVLGKRVKAACPTRVSSKSVASECPAKNVAQ